MWRERLIIMWFSISPPPQQPTAAAALTSLPGAFHSSGGAEAEQDGCVLGSGELREGGDFRQTRQ